MVDRPLGAHVRLVLVPDEVGAQVIHGLLASEGIGCVIQTTHASAEAAFPHYYEILVDGCDLERARELLDSTDTG